MREMCIKRFLKRVVTDRLAVESRHLEHKLFGALRHPFVRDEVQHIKKHCNFASDELNIEELAVVGSRRGGITVANESRNQHAAYH